MQTETYELSGFSTPFYKRSEFLPGKIIDIETSGRYWRTSLLQKASVIILSPGNSLPQEIIWTAQKEAEEYDILCLLLENLKDKSSIITYNGTGFDLPHLKRKASAYGLQDPFPGHDFHDLFLELKPLAGFLKLPSRKLEDYIGFFMPDFNFRNDAEKELALISLYSWIDFLSGKFSIESAVPDKESIIYTLIPYSPLPGRLSLPDGPFYLTAGGLRAKLSVRTYSGMVRNYYTDYKNYDFLPEEGYAIHKSMSRYVGKNRKEKAVRENCFTLIRYNDALLTRQEPMKKYIASVFAYLLTG